MNIFQIFGTIRIIVVLFFISKSKGILIKRTFYVFATIIGLILFIFPTLTQRIANYLGIGRGVDLFIYLFILFSWFWFISTSAKIQSIEQKITQIVREISINNSSDTDRFNEINKNNE